MSDPRQKSEYRFRMFGTDQMMDCDDETEHRSALALRALSKQGWFSQRSSHTRTRLSSIAKLRNFAKDGLVYLAGDPPSGVFGLVTGSLNISYPRADGEDYTVHRAGSGFWIGDVALFAKGGRLVSS